MQVVLASGNAHKAEEISAALPEGIELVLQSDLGIDSVEETGLTFIENALIKARNAATCSGLPALADDSGISVEALGTAPGIYSARYARADASDLENLDKLLVELGEHPNRSARFHCVLVLLQTPDDPTPLIAEGTWHGEIAQNPSGAAGFGYDPVFYLPERRCTAAELTMTEKNKISHRGIALRQMTRLIRERYPA